MQILYAILGAVVLLFGRRLYWLAIGVLGFLVGVRLAAELLTDTQFVVQLLAALAAGAIGAILAIVFQRAAFAVGGLFAGAYLAQDIAVSVGANPDSHLIWLVIGALVGGVIAAVIMDWAIIMLTSLVGAGAIVNALGVSGGATPLLFLILVAVGMAIQAWQFRAAKHTNEAAASHARTT